MQAVEIDIPGSHQWCHETKAALDDWTEGLAASEKRAALEIFPAMRVEKVDKQLSQLSLRWVEVPGESAWEAAENAIKVLKTVAPTLAASQAMGIRTYPQDEVLRPAA